MKALLIVTVGATILTLGAVTEAEAAQVIVAPVSAQTNMGEFSGSWVIENTFDQSGLSATYDSGETDFDTYLSGNPTHSGETGTIWASRFGKITGTITFDLGNVYDVGKMALFNHTSLWGVKDFKLFASSTGDDGSYTSLGSFTADKIGEPSFAQVFNFDTTAAQFIKMDINSNHGGGTTEIREVAFAATAAATAEPVPEPLTILGSTTALGFGALFKRKHSKKA